MKKILTYTLLLVMFQGCAIIHTPGFNSGYKRLNDNEKRHICFVKSINEIPSQNDGRIMAVNSKHLVSLLQNKDTALVYIWSPHCSSSVCVSLQTIQELCDNSNLNLYVLTEYYTDAFLQNEILQHPMLSINEFYYNTSYCNSYLRMFLSEIIPENKLQSSCDHRFILFSKGRFVESYEKIEDIDFLIGLDSTHTRYNYQYDN